ncbi:2,3,4,5-tetrahydropyridine-2,6-dicarboxylate N-succinyltransferase [Caedimonas varicaedens]|jgi:2,3,4,5-tetrahydropyridine-2-carboxylate N-succinyltransferase|uniref:2,3,4,5-tetrahydropyridine-2,6-dicarboxylate N-succinyltransferase n=1 Tax=Caedimonas varicaedens TaxID=1629334 RepID=A0A0K8MAE3_9PROT|nr:2,3,4,5-tetrahydropyridine-2,6-dicarboxylate N-succinyltransferase [Caedimonas varicaedens]
MNIKSVIEEAWENRAGFDLSSTGEAVEAVRKTLSNLDTGKLRVAEKKDDVWVVHQWIKKAILLSFRLSPNTLILDHGISYDKIPLKFEHWTEAEFANAGFRVVPGAIVRHSAYIAPDAILMPSFVNVGAYIGNSTMIDTWATVGSCVQIGERCHISGGTGLGGVLEPVQANPVIIEDDCFIGARSEIVEGVIVERGAVIGMGVFIGSSTPIVNRETGEILYGRIPAYSVVIAGSIPSKEKERAPDGLSLNCAVIVKTVDEKTRLKTAINDLLRAA